MVLCELLLGESTPALQIQNDRGLSQRLGRPPSCRVDQHRAPLSKGPILASVGQDVGRPVERVLLLAVVGDGLGHSRCLRQPPEHDVDVVVGIGEIGGQLSAALREPLFDVTESACVEEPFEQAPALVTVGSQESREFALR